MRAVALLLIGATGLAACGGESSSDSGEAVGQFTVGVTRASFPLREHVAKTTDLVLAVENQADKTIPQLAFTIWTTTEGAATAKAQGSFNVQPVEPRGGARAGPVWVPAKGFPKLLEAGVTLGELGSAPSAGAEAAQTDTYTFGALRPHQSRTAVWRVTPVRAGTYTLHYAIAAGLAGRARAVSASGKPDTGEFQVTIE